MEISNRRINLTHPTGVSTFAIRTCQRSDQSRKLSGAKELPPLPPKGKLFFKIPTL